MLLFQLRPLVEPVLAKEQIGWQEFLPSLELVEEASDLREALVNPEAFFEALLNLRKGAAAGHKLMIALARENLGKMLKRRGASEARPEGMAWEEFQPVMEAVSNSTTVSDAVNKTPGELLQLAIKRPLEFFNALDELDPLDAINVEFSVALERIALAPAMEKVGIAWDDVKPIVEEAVVLHKQRLRPLQAMLEDARERLEPSLQANGFQTEVTWRHVMRALEHLPEANVRHALHDGAALKQALVEFASGALVRVITKYDLERACVVPLLISVNWDQVRAQSSSWLALPLSLSPTRPRSLQPARIDAGQAF